MKHRLWWSVPYGMWFAFNCRTEQWVYRDTWKEAMDWLRASANA